MLQVAALSIYWEKVTTTNFTTSKFKKNIEKSSKHQNIKSVFLVHHYYNNQNIESVFLVDQNIEIDKDQNVESS